MPIQNVVEAYGNKLIGKHIKGGGGGQGGGHVIENAAGTDLIQRDTMQFIGGLKATDDAINGKTLVDDSPTVVTWEQWNAMTPAQKAAIPKARITDVPGAEGEISAEMFKELWRNPNPTNAFAAQNIELSSDDYDFLLIIFCEFTTNRTRSSVIIPKRQSGVLTDPDIGNIGNTNRLRRYTYIDDTTISFTSALVASSSSYSENNSAVIPIAIYGIKKTLTLNFSAIAADVSTSADKCMLSDGETSVADVLSYGSVKILTDGTNSYATLLNQLFTMIDFNKITGRSYIVFGGGVYQITYMDSAIYQFSRPEVDSQSSRIIQFIIQANNSRYRKVVGTTYTDESSTVPTNGLSIELFY